MLNDALLNSVGSKVCYACSIAAAGGLLSLAPIMQSVAQTSELEGVIVTAQKREQSLSDVGMAVTARSDDQLRRQGINDVADLSKIEPSFIVSQAQYGTPVYSIRGVGYNEQSLAASPAVSIYVDELPYAYPALTKGAALDLERVEILKGPQGTLYGQNATGGAINYIAAKPTSTREAGLEGTYGRFDAVNVNGFISGPLTDQLRARLAFEVIDGGAWQESYTRNDTIGETRQNKARLLLDWTPTEKLSLLLNVNGWTDKSDTPVTQLFAITLLNPPFAGFVPNLVNHPLAPARSQAADWFPGIEHVNDQRFHQGALRMQYDLADHFTLTSLTSYQDYSQDDVIGNDGVSVDGNSERQVGTAKSFSQELRAGGDVLEEKLNWLFGLTYAKDEIEESITGRLPYTTPAFAFTPLGLAPFSEIYFTSNPTVTTKAVFANLEFAVRDNLSVHGGMRYTDSDTDFTGCLAGDANFTAGLMFIQNLVKQGVGVAPVQPGECLTFDQNFNPGLQRRSLDENNVSWRVGADWHPVQSVLLYATASKGYKAGSFPALPGTGAIQYQPVTQESLIAYEVGIKADVGANLDLTAAVFHYDYDDKQLRARIIDPTGVFGVIDALVNIPESQEDGAELALTWRPLSGLALTASATYLDARVTGRFETIDVFTGSLDNFDGYNFPATPEWTAAAGAQYGWSLSGGLNAFVRADYRYQTEASSAFESRGDQTLGYPSLGIDAYGLLDLRAGLESADGRWSAQIFGKNVTNEHYWTFAARIYDTSVRYAGRPAAYGMTVKYHWGL